MTEPLQGWTIQRWYGEADYPCWSDECHFRSKERAEADAQRLNDKELAAINAQRKSNYDWRQKKIAEHQVLIAAGLREEDRTWTPDPEFVPQTELAQEDTRYRVVPLEFADDDADQQE